MEKAHTPGPWIKDSGIDAQASVTVELSHSVYIPPGIGQDFGSKVYFAANRFNPSLEANARLIAAAPDLLEALNLTYELLSAGQPLGSEDMAQLSAAIAKARGE